MCVVILLLLQSWQLCVLKLFGFRWSASLLTFQESMPWCDFSLEFFCDCRCDSKFHWKPKIQFLQCQCIINVYLICMLVMLSIRGLPQMHHYARPHDVVGCAPSFQTSHTWILQDTFSTTRILIFPYRLRSTPCWPMTKLTAASAMTGVWLSANVLPFLCASQLSWDTDDQWPQNDERRWIWNKSEWSS